MPTALSDFQIKNVNKSGNFRCGPSLYLYVWNNKNSIKKQWRIRQTIDGKRKWIFIGTYPHMSPSEARAKASELLNSDQAPQAVLREEKQTKVDSAIRAEKQRRSFSEVSKQYIEEIKLPVWNDGGRSEQSWICR